MRNIGKLLAVLFTSGTFFALSNIAHAGAFTWEFTGSTNNTSDSGNGNAWTGMTSLAGLNVTYSAWANTLGDDGDDDARFDRQELKDWGDYNLGLETDSRSADWWGTREDNWMSSNSGSPNHAIDNEDAQEFVLFEFSEDVVLDALAIGWPDWGSGDTDMTVMAYTGAGALPSLTGLSSEDILGNDLFFIEHLVNVPKDYTAPGPLGDAVSFNTVDSVSSRYWMVGAYNHHLGGNLSRGNDYVKLGMLGGYTPVEAPEPGSLIIFGLGLLGLGAAGRRRRTVS